MELTTQSAPPNWSDWLTVDRIVAAQVALDDRSRGAAVVLRDGALELAAWQLGVPTVTTTGPASPLFDHARWLSRDGRHVYKLVDVGGDEFGHVHRFALGEEGPGIDLTPNLDVYNVRGGDGAPGDDGVVFVAVSSKGFSLLHASHLRPPRSLLQTENEAWYPRFSADGSRIAVDTTDHAPGTRDWGVTLVDATDGSEIDTLVEPGGSVNGHCFSPVPGDSRLLVAVHGTGGGLSRAAIWNPDTNETEPLEISGLSGDAEVSPLDWGADGDAILLGIEELGSQHLVVYDVQRRSSRPLDVPAGSYWFPLVRKSMFGDGESVLATQETAARPLTVWAVAGESCRPVLSSGAVPSGVPFESVVFPSRDGTKIQGWLVRPATPGPFPAVIHAHGGPHWQVSDTFNPRAQIWVANGFAYFDVNFRGSTGRGRKFMQQIWGDVGRLELEDLVAARAWLVGNDVAFPDQILVAGESYGGFLALYAVGREPELWAAAIVEAAVGDWSLTYRDASPMLQAALRTWFRGTPDERAELYRDRSPLTWANRVSAPIYAIQGRNDTRTAPAQMATYIERLEQLDKPVVVDWLDAGHAGAGPAQDVHFMRRRLDFARAVLDAGG